MSQETGGIGSALYSRQLRRPSAPTVVMVHGFVVSGEYFAPTYDLLADRYSLAVPDLPGFGKSPKPDHTYRVPELAASLQEWLTSRQLPGSVLLANSFGCQVASEVAMRWPQLITRLMLVSPAIDPTMRRLRHLLPAAMREAATHSPALQRLLLADYRRAGIGRALTTLGHARWDRLEDKLPRIEVPTLVVRGTGDPLVSPQWAEAAAAMLPRGELVVVEDAPHPMNFEAPEKLVTAIEGFLAGES